jgi:methylenetetrahydrofolate reductase (NADPH)
VFSFEFFPPKTEDGLHNLFEAIGELRSLRPDYVSVTYGAGGSTAHKTIEIVSRIKEEYGIEAMAHFTCVGSNVDQLRDTLGAMEEAGVDNVLALRGDPPRDQPQWQPVPGGFRHANELASFIREQFDFCLGGACYPEKHHEAPSAEQDLRNLAKKVGAGAEFLITQLFFDDADYWSFVARARALGIGVPIVPGIMPMRSLANLERIAALSPGSRVPRELAEALARAGGDEERSLEVGVAWAARQCHDLLARGAPGIHYYTMNLAAPTLAVHRRLAP